MPDPILQATALRYAAGDLTPEEVTAFESRMAQDQTARDALSEAVRLSAKAIGQKPPKPHPSFRDATRAQLKMSTVRGHPFAWLGLGAGAVAISMLLAMSLADNTAPSGVNAISSTESPLDTASDPRVVELEAGNTHEPTAVGNLAGVCEDEQQLNAAEIWADLSNHETMEKARDDEFRWRHRVRDVINIHNASEPAKTVGTTDASHP